MAEYKIEDFCKDLDEKFMAFHGIYGTKNWQIHSWEYYGMSYGFNLWLKDNIWKVIQMVDSGYNQGKVLFNTEDMKEVMNWTECFAPTNRNYKTDRK